MKKKAFYWMKEATESFEKIKLIMCTTHVLAIPNFTKTFIIECDAPGHGLGAFLM